MMLRDDVINEGYHGVEAEQHEQSLNEAPHNNAVYTTEAGR
jgi:hypothetical protein